MCTVPGGRGVPLLGSFRVHSRGYMLPVHPGALPGSGQSATRGGPRWPLIQQPGAALAARVGMGVDRRECRGGGE